MIEKIILAKFVVSVMLLFFLTWIIKTFFDLPIAIKYHKKKKLNSFNFGMIIMALGIFIILILTYGFSYFSYKFQPELFYIPFYVLVLIELIIGGISFFIGNSAPSTIKFVSPYGSDTGQELLPRPGFNITWEKRNSFEITSEWFNRIWWISFVLLVIILVIWSFAK